MEVILPGIIGNGGANKINNDCLDVIILLFVRAVFLINWQQIFL